MRDLAPCCVCGSSDRTVRFPATPRTGDELPAAGPYAGHYRINTCNGCGLVYSTPIFEQEQVLELYSNFSEANVAEGEIENVRVTMRNYYELGRPFLPRKQRALDIGCDIGLLLEVMQSEGFTELHGLEPVGIARAQAVKRVPGADISGSFYEDTDFQNIGFDLITLIHVLDHLVRPDMVLDRVYHDLQSGGICIAVVHDIESVLARLMGERFPVLNYFHHYFFSRRTLQSLFVTRGFEVLALAATRNRYSLSFFIDHMPFLAPSARRALALLSRRLAVGHISLSIPVGNIGIVVRKPETAGD